MLEKVLDKKINFFLKGTANYEIHYSSEILEEWLDSAINGLMHNRPFCVTAKMDSNILICLVSYGNSYIYLENNYDSNDELNEKILDFSKIGMNDFCRELYADVSRKFGDVVFLNKKLEIIKNYLR